MEWTAPKPAPSSPPHLLWDWGDAAAPGASREPAGRRGKEKRAKGEEGGGGGGGGGGGEVRCQVEGCGVELRAAKVYHRKHRVCEAHTKCPRVVVAGQERRFCQQCSRFHALSEFDQKKRSCRRRLSDHNARRRKPQPDAFSFAPARLPSSLLFDDRRQISFVWNKAPLSHVRPFTCSPWDSPSDFKFPQVKEIKEVSTKVGTTNGQVHLDKFHLSNAVPTLSHDIDELLPMRGPDASLTASKLDGAPDLQRALSLLSSSSCGLPDPVQQASCLLQFTGASQHSWGLPLSHGGSSASASCAEGQPMAQASQLVHFTMDGSSNGYESTVFGVNRIN